MAARTLPSMDVKISDAQASEIKRRFMISMLNAKADWLEKNMKKLLPGDMYRMAHSNEGTDDDFFHRQEMVKRYLRRQDIRIEEHGLNARLFKGKVLIDQFFVKLVDE